MLKKHILLPLMFALFPSVNAQQNSNDLSDQELKTKADSSFKACKSQLQNISKNLKKDGFSIQEYYDKYSWEFVDISGKPILASSDELKKMVQSCLSKHYSKLGIYWDNNNSKYTGENKLGKAVEDIIDQWVIEFDKVSGGVIGTTYDIMKGNGVLGTVEKTGRNKYKAKLSKHIRPYAFKSGKLDKTYVDLIKTAINTDRDLDFRDVNDKTGVIIFTTILDK